ncbi:MAG: type II secretion system ATPase GspE [Pseudomonadota bacterium]
MSEAAKTAQAPTSPAAEQIPGMQGRNNSLEQPVQIADDNTLTAGPSAAALQQPVADEVVLLPFAFARRFGVVITTAPTANNKADVVCKSHPSLTTLAEIRRLARRELAVRTVPEDEFEQILTETYSRDSSQARQMVEDLGEEMDLASLANSVPETEDLLEQEDDAPIIRLINALLAEAIRENASDVHIETFEKELVVRFRVDGVMREVVKPKRELAPLLVSRIKVMARLDIAEKRIPQDGRISLRIGGREVDVRVSTMPASSGERVVLRLLDKQAGRLSLENLGMSPSTLQVLRSVVHKPHGIFLVTGPTGSGKTTTLYASLAELSAKTINILTVEDPIEYNLPGIGQTQVNTKADMTFARGLRAILRQDPDVVMVGEIRDLETAQIGIQASLTGHLVMSTLHTNTAVGAVTRLMDMGVEPFLLSSSLVGVLAQRLVRQLCQDCRQQRQADSTELQFLREQSAIIYEAAGCDACGHTGFKGRSGIYELVSVDDTIRRLIHDQVSEQELAGYARRVGPSIRDDGKAKVLAGVTTVQEVLRVTLDE